MSFFETIKNWLRLRWQAGLDRLEDLETDGRGRLIEWRQRWQAWRDQADDSLEIPDASRFARFKHWFAVVFVSLFSWEPPDFNSTFWLPITAWLRTRPYRLLWRALPALLVCGAMVSSLAIGAGLRWVSRTANAYQFSVRKALQEKDYETARVASMRLLKFGGSREAGLFFLALSLDGLGRKSDVAALLAEVAPPSRPVYVPAHLYVAKTLLAHTNLTAQRLAAAEGQLNLVLALDPASPEAHDLLGRLHVRLQRWELAQKHLAIAALSNPYSAVFLASLLAERGDFDGARIQAAAAAQLFRQRRAQEDGLAARLAWAKAMALQEDFPAALALLQAGRPGLAEASYAWAMGEVYLLWAQQVQRARPGDLRSRIGLLQQGLTYAPRNPGLLKMLAELSLQSGNEAEPLRQTLNALLAEGKAPEFLHFLLGSAAWEKGNVRLANEHFQLAYAASSNTLVIANNMAYLLAMGDTPDLPRALTIVTPLLDKYPDNPNLRDTRGQIYARLGRWREAVADLEFALPRLVRKGQTHQALAKAYRGLGMAEMAAEHERLARQSGEGPLPPP